jgi:hypothetical protein
MVHPSLVRVVLVGSAAGAWMAAKNIPANAKKPPVKSSFDKEGMMVVRVKRSADAFHFPLKRPS